MAKPRSDASGSSRPVDMDLHDMLVDLDSLRDRVANYKDVSEQRQRRTDHLEAKIQQLEQELIEARQEIATLRGMLAARASGGTQSPAQDMQSVTEELERKSAELRRTRKVLHDLLGDRVGDWLSMSQPSVVASSPSAPSVLYSQTQPMSLSPTEAATPLNPNEPTPRATRVKLTPRERHAGHDAHPADMPEPVTPVARAPTRKKRTPKPSRDEPSTSSLDGAVLSPSGLPVGQALPAASVASAQVSELRAQVEVSAASEQRAGKTANARGRGKVLPLKPREDPWDTEVTYDGPEEINEGDLSPSEHARKLRAKRRDEKHSESGQRALTSGPDNREAQEAPVAATQWDVLDDGFPEPPVVKYGPIRESKLFKVLDLPSDFIEQLDAAKGSTSYHLQVRGEHLFIDDPIGLQSSTGQHYLINWGNAEINRDLRRIIWDEGRTTSVEYHTFVRRHVSNKHQWYYMGRLRWTTVEMISKWPKYDEHRKAHFTKMLQRRWHTKLLERDIAVMIELGDLEEFCIELVSNSDLVATSDTFVGTLFPQAFRRQSTLASSSLGSLGNDS